MFRLILLALIASSLSLPAANAEAQRPERARRAAQSQTAGGFTSAEREVIARFFETNRVEVQALPPGIARNLGRGKPLPPGIAKRQLPPALVEQLPERNDGDGGVEITIFGDRIVLLEASGLVVDIIDDIFR